MSTAVISAWSAVSPFGVGAERFADGVRTGRSGVVPIAEISADADIDSDINTDADRRPVPQARTAPVPGFDPREALGRKGTRSMDRLSALAVAATGGLLAPGSRERELMSGPAAAFVLGTTLGSAKSMMDITRDTLTQRMPYFIDTGRIPNAIMNSAAAQCAIWHGLRGPNATIAGGRIAGLLALRYALRLLSAERATAVVCGAAEELTPERMWLEHHAREAAPGVPLGEGCGLLLIEPAASAAPALAQILAVEVRVYPKPDRPRSESDEAETGWTGTYADCLRHALARAGVGVDELWAVLPSGQPEWLEAERAALDSVTGEHRPRLLSGQDGWGDAGAATAVFQVATLLCVPENAGRVVALMSIDRDGVLGTAVLRVGPPTAREESP